MRFTKGLLGEVSLQVDAPNNDRFSAAFSVCLKTLLITFELKSIDEANIGQRRIWLRFKCETPDQVLQQARIRGVFLPNDVVAMRQGGRGFFATDPTGNAVYFGTP
ncbi:MAG: hypothetical protein GIW98_07185 [Candidatus Eremiobacteraeota bacterium]|nr:hypothetical protein [Candidatus Eremiobacteraeota bacterium]